MKFYLLTFTTLLRVTLCSTLFLISSTAFAHTVTGFAASNCYTTGNNAVIKANITAVQNNTWFNWQFKDNSGQWKCFQNTGNSGNATATINGKSFNVTGARIKGNVSSVTLTILNATTEIDGVQVRVLMGDATNAPDCGSGTYEWGYNELFRIRVNSSEDCGSATGCNGNLLISGSTYYGGFEGNAIGGGSTDLQSGGGSSDNNRYSIVNTPSSISGISADFTPYGGNYMMVARRVSSSTTRAWYRTVTPPAAETGKIRTYSMCIWVTAVDATAPTVRLTATAAGATTQQSSVALSSTDIDKWKKVCVTIALPSTATSVTFTITDPTATTSNRNSFALDDQCLTFANEPTTPLPVKLADFKLSQENSSNALLTWKTAEEVNASRFEIQHSQNGTQWNPVGSVDATGESTAERTYTFVHRSPANGENLYRLKMVDNDGTFDYSVIRSIRFKLEGGQAEVYPNPARDVVYLKGNAGVSGVQLFNANGRVVGQQSALLDQGISLSSVPSGIYIMKISHKDGSVTSKKVLVEK